MKTLALTTAALMLPAASAMAHEGHDHGAATSDLMHAMFYAAPWIAAGIALLVWRWKKQ